MGIVDPDFIALLQNYRQAHQGRRCKISTSIGSVLVDSLCRSVMTASAAELIAARPMHIRQLHGKELSGRVQVTPQT